MDFYIACLAKKLSLYETTKPPLLIQEKQKLIKILNIFRTQMNIYMKIIMDKKLRV